MAAERAEVDGNTLLDPDEAEGLLPTFVTTRAQLNELEADNIRTGTRWAVKFRPRRNILTEDFIRELHRRMFGAVWRWAGTYRKSNTNIGVNWPTLPVATREFCLDVRSWEDARRWGAREIAVRFHHRLVQIHPFPNGNGRHARLLADVYLREKERPLRWIGGGRDIVRARKNYLAALRAADNGDFDPLLRFTGVKN
ncbi:MAG: mobile mystery protein B [Gemmatimonadales bacterium]